MQQWQRKELQGPQLCLDLDGSQRARSRARGERESGAEVWERGGLGEPWGGLVPLWTHVHLKWHGAYRNGWGLSCSGALDLFMPEQVLSWVPRALSHSLKESSCQSLVYRQAWGWCRNQERSAEFFQCLRGNLDFILNNEELLNGLSQEEAG